MCYFLLLTHATLAAYFTPDDMMNLYRSWTHSAGKLLTANLLFFRSSEFYRPMGSVWYRSIFHFAGFNPLPFHVASLIILMTNLLLTYSISRRLSNSREVALLATLIGCYHASLAAIYFDTGYIYDVLCCFFYFAAFLLYLRVRQAGEAPGILTLATCSLLYVCALNSKEMAVTLPLFLGIYELIYHPPARWSGAEVGRWMVREGRGPLVIGLITLVFIAGRLTGKHSLLSMEAYRPVFTWERLMQTSRVFFDAMVRQENWFQPAAVVALWVILWAIAWLSKSRVLKFAWLFLMLSPLPVAFLAVRGAPQYYIPWFGWSLYIAAALVLGTQRLLPHRARAAVLFAGIGVLLFLCNRAVGWAGVTSVTEEGPMIRSIVDQLHRLHPRFPAGSRLLFLDDPIEPDWEDMTFIVRLSYLDDTLVIDRAKKMKQIPDEAKLASYAHVFDYKGGRIMELTRPWRRSLTPMIVIDATGAEVFHEGWVRVTRERPAKPGELVIAKATDLGATYPPVSPGERFPASPFAKVADKITIHVNGGPSEPELQIGWPGMINIYRVDFRIPKETSSSPVTVQLTAGGVAGPPAEIPIAAANSR